MAGLGPTFGRGAMTNDWIDLKNSDCVLVIGGNPAENHPASIRWINKARERGAKLVVVDPRFNRTAATADFYAPLRSGTDIVFLGGLINYVLENKLYNEEYVKYYTNALTLINPDFKGPADLDGYFSGFNPEKKTYDSATWQYQTEKQKIVGADGKEVEVTVVKRAENLDEPNTVFAHLKRHFARYTPEMVERVCGTPKEKFPGSRQTLLRHRRARQVRHHPLCHGSDAAYRWHAERARDSHPPAFTGQHRRPRWWGERAAW